jgi:hypothetical protein
VKHDGEAFFIRKKIAAFLCKIPHEDKAEPLREQKKTRNKACY